MATESAPSVDVFTKNDPDTDKLVLRYKDGSYWLTLHCDSSGDLVFTDSAGQTATLDISAGTIS